MSGYPAYRTMKNGHNNGIGSWGRHGQESLQNKRNPTDWEETRKIQAFTRGRQHRDSPETKSKKHPICAAGARGKYNHLLFMYTAATIKERVPTLNKD